MKNGEANHDGDVAMNATMNVMTMTMRSTMAQLVVATAMVSMGATVAMMDEMTTIMGTQLSMRR